MKFGKVAIDEAEGGILVHSLRHDGLVLKKGDSITREHIQALRQADISHVVIARLEEGDIGEDEAAAQAASALSGENIRVDEAFTGRANLFATCNGVLVAEPSLVDAINAVDEQITLATLPPWRNVVEGEMVATVKIIPFALPRALVARAIDAAAGQYIRIAPYKAMRVAVLSTKLPGLKTSTIDKTLRVMAERLAPAGAKITLDRRIGHDPDELAKAIAEAKNDADMIVVFGASAITDRRDVIPAALVASGGRIEQFGMPVDPGNLLLIGEIDGKPFLGAPGCARSPKENGFDWVLHRMLAQVPVTAADIRRMGAGGLLMEIISRPQPRGGEASQDE